MTEPVAKNVNPFSRHFNPALWADQGRRIIPMMRAYGGIRQREARASLPQTLGRIGTLEVRLAANAAEVRRAQKLRWRVFYEEMQAIARDAAITISIMLQYGAPLESLRAAVTRTHDNEADSPIGALLDRMHELEMIGDAQ